MTTPKMDLNWLLGFIEGEGSFQIACFKSVTHKYGYRFRAMFSITLTEADLPILKKIQEYLGYGYIMYHSTAKRRSAGSKVSDTCSYTINKQKQCIRFSKLLKPLHWWSKKRKDFDLWCKGLEFIRRDVHLHPRGMIKICEIRDVMNKPMHKKPKGYVTAEEMRSRLPKHLLKPIIQTQLGVGSN